MTDETRVVIADSADQTDGTFCVNCSADFSAVSRWSVEESLGHAGSVHLAAYCARCAVRLYIATDTARDFLASELAAGR